MKEAFWGVLILMLGLFGIVVVNLFQKVTINNDQVYYVIKESTEASMYDAIDFTRYRLTGRLRIAEDKFVENLTRRFAQSITAGNYKIVVHDVNENPPKVSVTVRSGVSSLQGETFTITNRVDGILETKYTLEELLDFLGMTEEEWNNIISGEKDEENKNICDMLVDPNEYECTPGDIKFGGFEEFTMPAQTCSLDTGKNDVPLEVTYYTCDCGKWVEQTETVYATGVGEGNSIKYTWTFNKTGEYRDISETITKRTKLDVCTTSIDVMVPKDLRNEEPSRDNSLYVPCGSGIRIPENTKIVLHGGYTPTNATNRVLDWNKDNANITLSSTKQYVSKNSYSRAIMVTSKVEKGETKESNVTAASTLNQASTCKVTVWDGSVDSLSCKDLTMYVGDSKVIESGYEPYNATKTDFEFSVENTSIATIDGNTITAYKNGTTKLIIKDKYTGKTNTCNISSEYKFTSNDVIYSGEPGTIYNVYDKNGELVLTTTDYDKAQKQFNELDPSNPYSETTTKITTPWGSSEKMLEWKGIMDNGDEFGCSSYGSGCINVTEEAEKQAELERAQSAQNSGNWVEVDYRGWSPSIGYYPITSLPTICPHPCL